METLAQRAGGALLMVLFACALVSAQEVNTKKWPLSVPKNTTVTVKIPGALLGFERFNAWRGTFNYSAYVTDGQAGDVLVNQMPEWKGEGWPLMTSLNLEKISRKDDYTEVELRSGNSNVKLRFSGVRDLNAAFDRVVFVGSSMAFEASDYYRAEVAGRFLPRIFTGPLAKIPQEDQLRMMKGVNYDLRAIRGEEFKNKFYLAVRMGTGEVYNSIQLDQSARVNHVLGRFILPGLKESLRLFAAIPEIEGLKVEIPIQYKNFVSEQYLNPYADELQVYLPAVEIKKFAENDITNQDLLDASVALLNGSRVKVTF
jgi:hypothetical protein